MGKLKENYYAEAQAEYLKMLGRFCTAEVIEVADEPLNNVRSKRDEDAARQKEGARILEKCAGYIVACDMRGKRASSELFANRLQGIMMDGTSTVTFVIGGSVGLSYEVLGAAGLTLSFSDMTMPHRLFRIVLLEQVFRAFKIINHETYHK